MGGLVERIAGQWSLAGRTTGDQNGGMDEPIIDWLLAGDPAIRWQVRNDLIDASPNSVGATRELVATEGWGARFLAEQDADDRWGGGLYSPKWISTTYTLLSLERLGLADSNPAAAAGTRLLVDAGLADHGGVTFWPSRPEGEGCVTGMVLKLMARFLPDDPARDRIVDHLAARQLPDGGWNCQDVNGATHSSLHTTITVLEGLAAARRAGSGGCDGLMANGNEFMFDHHLYRSHTTGEVISPAMTRFSFPPRWWFDVLRGLDYLQSVDAEYDERLEDPIALMRRKRTKGGRWKLQNRHSGLTYFAMEDVGKPSRMNTLRALRVERWWERTAPGR